MPDTKTKTRLISIIGFGVPLVILMALSIEFSARTPMWMDEYVFYRLAGQFPDYHTTSDWFWEDRPALLAPSTEWPEERAGVSKREFFSIIYDTPIYTHTPLPVLLVSPVVKALNWTADNSYTNHIENSEYNSSQAESTTAILRMIPIGLFATSMCLIFALLKRKVGHYALFTTIPVIFSLTLLSGSMWFYWDAFMMFFLALTLYLMETRPDSKWRYVSACCLVNTKLYIGILFLVPLILKNKKVGLAILSIIPFYITTWVVTGDPFYVISHYIAQIPIREYIYSYWTSTESFNVITKTWGLQTYLILTIGGLALFKQYPVYVLFWIFSLVYAFGTGIVVNHVSTILYSGALLVPLIAHHLRIVERVKGGTRQLIAKIGEKQSGQ